MARKKKRTSKSSGKKILKKILFVIALVLVCYYAYTYLVESGFFKNDFFPNVNKANTEEVFESEVIESSSGIQNEKTIEEAALLAAYYSKAKESSLVPVDATKRKFIKKPSSSLPGKVIYTNQTTYYITPTKEQINKIKRQR